MHWLGGLSKQAYGLTFGGVGGGVAMNHPQLLHLQHCHVIQHPNVNVVFDIVGQKQGLDREGEVGAARIKSGVNGPCSAHLATRSGHCSRSHQRRGAERIQEAFGSLRHPVQRYFEYHIPSADL